MIYSLDTETFPIAPGCIAPKLVCGSVSGERVTRLLDADETIQFFKDQLSYGNHLVGLNFSYDLGVLCAEDPELTFLVFEALEKGLLHDIAIREALIDIARGTLLEKGDEEMGIRYGMRELSKRYMPEEIERIQADKKGENSFRLRYGELFPLAIKDWAWEARAYPLRDAEFTLQIYLKQEGGPNLHDEKRQMRAAFVMQLMSIWGLRTNREKVSKLRAEVEKEWNETRERLGPHKESCQTGCNLHACIFRADGSKDTKALGDRVTAAYRGSPPKTGTGKVATDRDTLLESGDPTLMDLAQAGKNDKRLSTYLPILEKGLDAPWNPQSNPLVASGRASGDGQQFPTGMRSKGGIREAFEPRPGFCYSSNDYPGLELFTMSQRAIKVVHYSKMAELLIAGKDCHSYTAAQFMSITYEDFLPHKKEDKYAKFRNLGKIFNFGKGGGMGGGAMAYNAREKDGVRFCETTGRCSRCGDNEKSLVWVRGKRKGVCSLCIEISKKLGYDWLDAYPEQKELFQISGDLHANGTEDSVTVPYSERVRGGCNYTRWLNTPFQGLGGDIAKDAMWRVSREMYTDPKSVLWGSRIVLFVHDELICEHPLRCASEAAERVAKIMMETLCDWCPDVGPAAKVEPAISMIMSKGMTTVYGPDKRLMLWEETCGMHGHGEDKKKCTCSSLPT